MYETRLNAVDRWLQGLLTWTPGQTDIIKTVALVLMIVDHTGLLLAGNNELMRLLGTPWFSLRGRQSPYCRCVRFLPVRFEYFAALWFFG